jgi:hypothetical protein
MREQLPNESEEPYDSFLYMARHCTKKKNKGAFDEIITTLYRLKQLTKAYDTIQKDLSNKQKLQFLLKNGMKYKEFSDFKADFEKYQSFEYLSEMTTLKEFFNRIEGIANNYNVSFEKAFLAEIKMSLSDQAYALDYLQTYVGKDIKKKEMELDLAKKHSIE